MTDFPTQGAQGWRTGLKNYIDLGETPSYAGTRTRAYDADTGIYGSDTARRNTRRALGFTLGGSLSAMVPITLAGDSATSGWKANNIGTDDYATVLTRLFTNAGYPTTGGWVYPGNGQTPGDVRWTFGGTNSWQGKTTTTNNYVWSTATGNTATFTSTSVGTVLEFTVVCTAASQTVTFDRDGGAETGTFNLTANQLSTKQFTGLTSGTHTVTITTTGTSTIWLAGARVRNTTGLSITNAGIYGSHTNDWLPTLISSSIINPFNLTTGLTGTPRLVMLTLGGNDALHGTDGAPDYTPATFEANLDTVVSSYQAAGAVVVMRWYPQLTTAAHATLASKQAGGVTWETFIQSAYDVSDARDTVLIDHTNVLGDPNTLVAGGLLFSDGLHFLSPGQAALARADFKALQGV